MTKVALLWHMHQPYYEDLVTGEHILPWVRLHALKDYYGMVALLDEFPEVRVTFNLVPSLLVQIEAFADNRARDRHLELGLKPAASLTDEDRQFIASHFFHAQQARMIEPYPRYAELHAKRTNAESSIARNGRHDVARAFSEAELRDLQVWHKLAWIDESYKAGDARVKALIAKDRGFSEDDKHLLRSIELELLGRVIPAYRAARDRGNVEVSTSPFYHPILPLLCDTNIYLRTHPSARLPRRRFQHPDDALEQLRRAASLYERLFGASAAGVWPSEGSVSDDIVPLVARAGFRWMASDEVILARSLGVSLTRDASGHVQQPETLYRPYTVSSPDGEVTCLFRDHTLSDLIGFTYSNWDANAAVADFVSRLLEAGRRFSANTRGEEAVIAVILDGENAWEHFEGGGRPFLRALYARLAATPGLQTVTFNEVCTAATRRALASLFPGSWINGDFYIWIGHADDQRGWGQLADARAALDRADPGLDARALARAREEILIAEGSDWFWWYGDDHSSPQDPEFDDLFRRHLRNAYGVLGQPVPEELYLTNITTEPHRTHVWPPTGFIHPTLDGEVTSYFEWIGAGGWDAAGRHETMQPAEQQAGLLTAIWFGFDLTTLYLRLDTSQPVRTTLREGTTFIVRFLQPAGIRLTVRPGAEGPVAALEARQADATWVQRADRVPVAAGAILEVAVPFSALGVTAGDVLDLTVAVVQHDVERERQPATHPLEIVVPNEDFEVLNWTA